MEQAQAWTRALFNEQLAHRLEEGQAALGDRPAVDQQRFTSLLPFLEWLCTEESLPIGFAYFDASTVAKIASRDFFALLDREREQNIRRASAARAVVRYDSAFDVGNPTGFRCTVFLAKDYGLRLEFQHYLAEAVDRES